MRLSRAGLSDEPLGVLVIKKNDLLCCTVRLERAFFAVSAIGGLEAALEVSMKYAKEREQFGQPIANFQLIQAKIADMYTDLEAAR